MFPVYPPWFQWDRPSPTPSCSGEQVLREVKKLAGDLSLYIRQGLESVPGLQS